MQRNSFTRSSLRSSDDAPRHDAAYDRGGVRAGAPFGRAVDLDLPLDAEQRVPRRRSARELTTFNIVLLLIVAAIVITAYISNIIKVDALTSELVAIEKEQTLLIQQRENLRAELNMLSSYNRIQKIATEQIGLVHAPQQPFSLTVFGLPDERPIVNR
jgi:cell division protein FtsL